jgi:hypothetical protein
MIRVTVKWNKTALEPPVAIKMKNPIPFAGSKNLAYSAFFSAAVFVLYTEFEKSAFKEIVYQKDRIHFNIYCLIGLRQCCAVLKPYL